jgi:hypothetical protein
VARLAQFVAKSHNLTTRRDYMRKRPTTSRLQALVTSALPGAKSRFMVQAPARYLPAHTNHPHAAFLRHNFHAEINVAIRVDYTQLPSKFCEKMFVNYQKHFNCCTILTNIS